MEIKEFSEIFDSVLRIFGAICLNVITLMPIIFPIMINDKFKDDLKFILIKTLNEEKLNEILPLETTIKQAREIENIHLLIKNNGQDFNLTQEQLELAGKSCAVSSCWKRFRLSVIGRTNFRVRKNARDNRTRNNIRAIIIHVFCLSTVYAV